MDSLQREFQSPVLVEEFVEGREFYVGVLGNATPQALPVIELDFSAFPADRPKIASWEAKWGEGGTGAGRPAPSSPARVRSSRRIWRRSWRRGCRRWRSRRSARCGCATTGASICACRPSEEIYVIEVNPNCYLEREGEFARAAAEAGLAHDALVARIMELALARYSR